MRTLFTWQKELPPNVGAQIDTMRESLRAGVQVISAPQLFPTPLSLAARIVKEADIKPEHRVLEPSAGTGKLLDAINLAAPISAPWDGLNTVAVELSQPLAAGLLRKYSYLNVRCGDFLACNTDLGKFDRIVMNPPFSNGQDIAHILHALKFLKPGGRLVAICANGPRQQESLRPHIEQLGGTWEPLSADTFKSSGTAVNTALLTVSV